MCSSCSQRQAAIGSVRGKQGRKVDEFTDAQRSSSTARRLFDEPREAAPPPDRPSPKPHPSSLGAACMLDRFTATKIIAVVGSAPDES